MTDSSVLITIAVAWLIYFLLHSFFASLTCKTLVERHLPLMMPWYRLLYNSLALLLLLMPLSLLYIHHGDWVIELTGIWWWLGLLLNLIAIGGFIWSMRWYDGKAFLGLRQLQNHVRSIADQEHFHLSPMHRYVRHPWYSLGLLMLWSRSMDAGMLLSAVLITLYLLVGLRLEEKKLISYHGETYKKFRQKVPAILPRPWRYLTRAEASQLMQEYVKTR